MAVWRRSELKSGVYDEIVSARLDRQLAELGAAFEVHRAALKVSDPIGAVLESLLGDGFALALAELKADSTKGLALAEALLAVLRTHAPRVFERDDELRLNAERLTAIVAQTGTSARAAARIAACLEPDRQCRGRPAARAPAKRIR